MIVKGAFPPLIPAHILQVLRQKHCIADAVWREAAKPFVWSDNHSFTAHPWIDHAMRKDVSFKEDSDKGSLLLIICFVPGHGL